MRSWDIIFEWASDILSINSKYDKPKIRFLYICLIYNFTLSPGRRPGNSRVTGGATVNIGGTSCTSSTITITSKPAIFLVSWPPSAYASYTLKRNIFYFWTCMYYNVQYTYSHGTHNIRARRKKSIFSNEYHNNIFCLYISFNISMSRV